MYNIVEKIKCVGVSSGRFDSTYIHEYDIIPQLSVWVGSQWKHHHFIDVIKVRFCLNLSVPRNISSFLFSCFLPPVTSLSLPCTDCDCRPTYPSATAGVVLEILW